MKTYDIYLGRDNWYAVRVAQFVGQDVLEEWLAKGYRVQSEVQIGNRLHNAYLVKSK